MGGKAKDLTNNTYGKLKAIEIASRDKSGLIQWKCECECGNKKVVRGYDLVRGRTKSCGCSKSGYTKTKLGRIYNDMKNRCFNRNQTSYERYGGRGISISKEWLGEEGFINFKAWALGNGYSDNLSIDRMDVDGNYEPSNCKWSTHSEQQNNKTDTRYVTINNVTKPITIWARESGLSRSTIRNRLDRGWKDEELLIPPKIIRNK